MRLDTRDDFHATRKTPYYALSQVSLPRGGMWLGKRSQSFIHDAPDENKYVYHYDVASAVDTYVYMLGEDGIWANYPEFAGRNIEYLDTQHGFGPVAPPPADLKHGSAVAAMVVGNQLGLCPTCTLVVVTSTRPSKQVEGWHHYPNGKIIAQLLDVLDDEKRKGRQGKATIVMSFSYDWPHRISPMVYIAFRNLLQKLDELDVVLVASANNHALDDPAYRGAPREGMPVRRYPAKFADPNDQYGGLPNIIVVAATDMNALRVEESNFSPFVAAFAPGAGLHCPTGPSSGMEECGGTSLSAPQVAALANYFRSVPSHWQSQLNKPSNVKKLIQLYARYFRAMGSNVDAKKLRPVIWNGQIREHSCIREAGSTEDWAKTCPNIQDNLEDESTNPGENVGPCDPSENSNPAKRGQYERRQSGSSGSCPNLPGDKGPGKQINWEEGPSEPECTDDDHCGGELCKGYYCDPKPKIAHPPDYYDPKDPDNPHGQPPAPPPKPSSTTTTARPTQTSVPKETLDLCIGRTVTPTGQLTMNSYSAYTPDAICNGIFIVDGVIGSSPDICEAPETNFSIDQCGTDMTFIDEGPEFFDKCGFQLEIAGKKYTPRKLDASDDDNPCSGHCDLSFLTGLLLFEELEVPFC